MPSNLPNCVCSRRHDLPSRYVWSWLWASKSLPTWGNWLSFAIFSHVKLPTNCLTERIWKIKISWFFRQLWLCLSPLTHLFTKWDISSDFCTIWNKFQLLPRHLAPLTALALLDVFQARWASRFRVLCRKKVVGNFLGSQSGSSSLVLNAFCICAFKRCFPKHLVDKLGRDIVDFRLWKKWPETEDETDLVCLFFWQR